MTQVVNPRRRQQHKSSDAQPQSRERPRPPALKTSHSALRSVNRPPNVRRISNRVSIAEPEPEPEPEPESCTSSSALPKPKPQPANNDGSEQQPNLASNNPIAHTASTLQIAQTLHSSLSAARLRVTTTPWATRNILTLDGGGIRGYSSLILLRSLMRQVAAIETSLSPPAFSSADPTGNDNYYFTEHDEYFYGAGTEIPDCERAVKLREGRIKVGDLKVEVPEEVLRRGEYLPAHYFDYIAGTSVGGLIAIMLGVMGRTVEGCMEEFRGGNSGSGKASLPQLFVEMDEGQEVDVGDGGGGGSERKSREKAERRRRVISFPGLGRVEIPLFGGRNEKEKDKRRTTWPTKKSRAWFETFSKFSATSTDLTGTAGTRTVATSRAVASDTEEVSPKTQTQRRETNNSNDSHSRSSTTTTTSSSISFKKNSFQCQTLAWCSEIDSDFPTERHPYAFCTYEEVLVADDSDEQGKVPSIPEVAKAITTPSDSSQFKPFKLPAIGQFVDGSKEIRDPTLPVLKEISSLLGVDPSAPCPRGSTLPCTYDPPIDLLLSLGTDEHNAWFYEKLVQPFASTSTSSSPPETQPSTPAEEEELKRQKGHLYHHYRRFQVSPLSLPPVVSSSLPFLRRRRNNHLQEIEEATERWLAANNGEQRTLLRKYADMLVRKRRKRSATTRWETFALGVRYFCWHDGCEMNPDTHNKQGKKGKEGNGEGEGEEGSEEKVEGFDTRGDFWDHLDADHGMAKKAAAKGEVLIEEWLDKGRRFGFL
ncbi:hypothetical protein QBC32DRAFT_41068 [Pseudoneurospora amorphoporcata]|uniref:PNPLA domain-containing protein n=1 Tax=Pseudoneurospora amorphoporcata TaxID=241081 RepID=A0AAN6SDJ4_9PEZI|nr:hypothetical protein QBC32DRAFT_41068 [Pseudoneurospora amorphoporcata]